MNGYVRRVKRPDHLKPPRLVRLDIELTERCNNNCIHCCINLPEDDASAKSREMNTEQVRDVLMQAADLGCLEVRFTGGEPLLRPDFEDLYIFARRLGMKVLLFTNGCLIEPELVKTLYLTPPLMPIEITVYGMHAESYEAVTRAPGSFDQFRRGVALLLEHRIPFIVKGVVLPPNRHEMDEFESWAESIPWMADIPSYVTTLHLRNRRDDEDKNRLIRSLRLTPQEVVKVMRRRGEKMRLEITEFKSKFMGPAGNRLFSCGLGRGACVDAYGFAQPCMGIRTPELTHYIVRPERNSPGENTGSSPLLYALDRFSGYHEIITTNALYLRRCGVCPLRGLCEQCPAKSWTEHGTLDTPVEYFCEVAREMNSM